MREMNLKPKDGEELSQTLLAIRGELDALGAKGLETYEKVAADLKAAHESVAEAKKDAAHAREIAEILGRTAPGPKAGQELAHLELAYDVERDESFRGKMNPLQYRFLRATSRDLEDVGEDARRAVRRFQAWNDVAYMYDSMMLGQSAAKAQEYIRGGGLKASFLWRKFQEAAKSIAAAGEANDLTDTSNWVPTGVGSMLIEDVRAEFPILAEIETVPMPRSPYLYPVRDGASIRGYRGTENTAQTGQTQIGVLATSDLNVTFTAELINAMFMNSMELEQDAIVNMLFEQRNDLAFAAMASEEQWLINGQVSAAGSPSTFDTGINVTTTDDLYCGDGLRYWALALVGGAADFSTGVTDGLLRAMIARQGKYGKRRDNVWATGYLGEAQLLGLKDGTGRSLLLVPGDMLGAATINTGEVPILFGSRLHVVDSFSDELTPAGIYDGATKTCGGLLRFNRRMLKRGQVMLPTIETSREQFWQFNQVATKINLRMDYQPVRIPSATYRWVVGGVGISNSF